MMVQISAMFLPNISVDTFITQNVLVSTDSPGELCVTCVFITGASNTTCSSTIRHTQEDENLYIFEVFQAVDTDRGTTCVSGISTGFYMLSVCDTTCSTKSSPQHVYQNISITGIGTCMHKI